MDARVLIVDDEALIRWFLSERLEQEGLSTFEAEDGASAAKRFKEPVSLVVLDVKLPDANGLDLLRRFRVLRPEVPVILMSAHGDEEMARQAKAEGAFAFLAKPFDVESMVRLVRSALGRAG